MKLPNRIYEEIKESVTNLLIKHNISCVPINGFEIANKMGIEVRPYPQKKYDLFLKVSEDGFTVFEADKTIIYYNPYQMYQRMNNTIVHEIGHIVLGHLQESELAEAEVNFFAKYLLAPPVLIHKLQLHSPDEIANIFEISHQAAQIAWDYYNKWLLNSGRFYKPYEIKLIDLFQNNIGEHLQSNTQYSI